MVNNINVNLLTLKQMSFTLILEALEPIVFLLVVQRKVDLFPFL